MCDPVTLTMAATAAYGASRAKSQQDKMERAQKGLRSQQEQAERERQVQALEDRFNEIQRQNQVQRGTTQIDNLFSAFGLDPLAPESGFNTINLPDEFDPNADYVDQLLQTGGDFNRVFGTGSTVGLRDRAPNSDFFDQRQQSYLNYANPQLDRQLQQQREGLAFNLTRAGLGRSSSAADRTQELGQQANQARQQIADQARQVANDARGQLLDTRQGLVGMLEATGDPNKALAGAGERLSMIQETPSFQPLGQIFAGVTEGLGQYNQGFRRGSAGIPLSGFFNRNSLTGAGSSRIVGGG